MAHQMRSEVLVPSNVVVISSTVTTLSAGLQSKQFVTLLTTFACNFDLTLFYELFCVAEQQQRAVDCVVSNTFAGP
jgi:hypothetical protein